MIFRIIHRLAGGHVHCDLFCAPAPNQTFAKCGSFVVCRGPEFEQLLRAMPGVNFVPFDEDSGIAECIKP